MTLLETAGAFALAFIAAIVAFYFTFKFLEIAAITPMLIVGVVAAIAAGAGTLWWLL